MGDYSVPEAIRKYKPKGTMVKCISGHYYVYEYSTVRGTDGKRHTKMGKLIGAIKEGIGFIPNNTYVCNEEVSTLEFGEYAIVLANSTKTLALLKTCFNPEDAYTIYAVAMIHFIHGFTYMKDIHAYYEMSYLSLLYPSLKLGYNALSSLYENLGKRRRGVLLMEEKLLKASSRQVAIDGHVIGCCSADNDLASKGYKFNKLGEAQVNLLMAYDVNTHIPLLSRIYEGGMADKISVKDLVQQIELKNMLFIVDRGFYSTENIELFSDNGNSYIIPLGKSLNTCKKAVSSLDMKDRFMYQKGKKASVVEFKDEVIEGRRVLTYRDLNESAAEQSNYLRHIKLGDKNYTNESLMEMKDLMGVTVLQTSLTSESPEEIYTLYKKRWSIETFYNYFKNRADYNTLYQQDYYKTQGLAFIMLVSALIFQEFECAAKAVPGKSVQDCLLAARMLKADKRSNTWVVSNCRKKVKDLFCALHTDLIVALPT